MRNVAAWKQRFVEHADLIMQVYTTDDIRRAKSEGRLGIFLGWQNSSAYDDYLPFVAIFAELGVRVVQLTYNTANAVGSGCYESEDRGLTDFGHDLVAELNRNGVLIDLSHTGARTAADTIRASARPVCYTHTLPAAQSPHPRNKSDEELRLLAQHDGFVGATAFPAFLRIGDESTIEDYLDAVEYLVDTVGEQQVGIGTDFTEGRGPDFSSRSALTRATAGGCATTRPGMSPRRSGGWTICSPRLPQRCPSVAGSRRASMGCSVRTGCASSRGRGGSHSLTRWLAAPDTKDVLGSGARRCGQHATRSSARCSRPC